jgi:hypothetical protein
MRLSSYPSLSGLITQYAQGTDRITSLGPHFERPGRTVLENHLLDVPLPSDILPSSSSARSILDPTGCGLGDVERVFFAGLTPPPSLNLPPTTRFGHVLANPEHEHSRLCKVEHNPIVLTKSLTWLELLGYLRSWSALHNYFKHYPQDRDEPTDQRFLEEDVRTLEVSDGSAEGMKLSDVAIELGVDKGDIAVRFWKDLRQGVSNAGGKSGVLDMVDVEWPVAIILARRT